MIQTENLTKKELIRRLNGYFEQCSPIKKEVDFLRAVETQAKGAIFADMQWREEDRLYAIRKMNQKGHPLKVLNIVLFNNSPDKEIRESMLSGLRDSRYAERVSHFRLFLEMLETADNMLSQYENPYSGLRRLVITSRLG